MKLQLCFTHWYYNTDRPASQQQQGDIGHVTSHEGEALFCAATTASAATAAVLSDGSIGTPFKKGVIVKPEVLHAHPGIKSSAAELPLPVLGYACLNCTLRHQKPTFFNNRTCRLATIKDPAKVTALITICRSILVPKL